MTDAAKLEIIREKLVEYNKEFDEDEAIDWAYAAMEMCRELLVIIDS